eukprot:tig00001249_g7788.t1
MSAADWSGGAGKEGGVAAPAARPPRGRGPVKDAVEVEAPRKCGRLSVRVLLVVSSVFFVACGVAFSWAITLSFGLRNVNALTDTLIVELSEHARDKISEYLVDSRGAALRSRDDFETSRLTKESWRETFESLNQVLQRNAGLFSTYVRFDDVSGLGANRCEPQHTDCPQGTRTYAHNATRMVFYGVDGRGQPVALAQGQNQLPFRVLPGDWYDKAMASPTKEAWSDLDYTPVATWTRIERLRVIFSAAFGAPPPLACSAASSLPARFPYPHGLAPPSQAACGAPQALGAVRTIIKVDALSRFLAELTGRLPGATFFLTTALGKMVAVDTVNPDELLDAADAPRTASASPNPLTRALYANARPAPAPDPPVPPHPPDAPPRPQFVERGRAGAAGRGVRSGAGLRVEGRAYFFAHTEVHVDPDLDWTLHFAVPEDVVLAEINRGINSTAIANSIWLLACAVLSVAIGLLITRPLSRLRSRLALLVKTLTGLMMELQMQAHRAAAGAPEPPEAGAAAPRPALSSSETPRGPSPRAPPPCAPRRPLVAPVRGRGPGAQMAGQVVPVDTPEAPSPPAPPRLPRRRPRRPRPAARAGPYNNDADRRPSAESGAGALRSGLAELARFEPLMAEAQARFLSFQELLSRETKGKLEAEARTRASRRFIQMVSHEMRNPLNVIIGMLQLAREAGGVPGEVEGQLRAAHEAAEHLLALIAQVVDIERIESGQAGMAAVPFSPHEALAAVARALRPRLEGRGMELRVEVPTAVPGRVSGDPERLRQVLAALLSNAVKFATGPVTLRVRVDESGALALDSPRRVTLRFEVADSGPGIEAEHRRHLFQPFYRVPLARIHGAGGDPGGTGLGLAISREVVERLAGAIGCESEPGAGSTFWFSLPFRTLDATPEDEKPPPAPAVSAPSLAPPPPPPPRARTPPPSCRPGEGRPEAAPAAAAAGNEAAGGWGPACGGGWRCWWWTTSR